MSTVNINGELINNDLKNEIEKETTSNNESNSSEKFSPGKSSGKGKAAYENGSFTGRELLDNEDITIKSSFKQSNEENYENRISPKIEVN